MLATNNDKNTPVQNSPQTQKERGKKNLSEMRV